MRHEFLQGDCIEVLRTLADSSVHCCVTSPPYWGLRDYGHDGQIGLESTPEDYVARMVEVFREVRRVLRDDGTCWLNLGDSYAANNWVGNRANETSGLNCIRPGYVPPVHSGVLDGRERKKTVPPGLKQKDLVGIPWRVAFALQADGWWLRQDIIWHKPNPMPESVRDRCTKAHEYVFLLTKSGKYFYDSDAIREPWTGEAAKAVAIGTKNVGTRRVNESVRRGLPGCQPTQFSKKGHSGYFGADGKCLLNPNGANKRSVWRVPTSSYKGAHFATMPTQIAETCIKAGCPIGGVVLDPFSGSGTTVAVAKSLDREGIGIELNPDYIALSENRIAGIAKEKRKMDDSQRPLFRDAV